MEIKTKTKRQTRRRLSVPDRIPQKKVVECTTLEVALAAIK
jgi:hypothetical protein